MYRSFADLCNNAATDEILVRLATIEAAAARLDAERVRGILGLHSTADVTLSQAAQRYTDGWQNPHAKGAYTKAAETAYHCRCRAVSLFSEINGDLPIESISQSHVFAFYNHISRPTAPRSTPFSAKYANRLLSSLQSVYDAFWVEIGHPARSNPFAAYRFREGKKRRNPPPSSFWIRPYLVNDDFKTSPRADIVRFLLLLVETGCRAVEIYHLDETDIIVDDPIPHLRIRHSAERGNIGSEGERDIPLVGVSLAAARALPPGGWPKTPTLNRLAKNTNRWCRQVGLFPDDSYSLRTFRQSFKRRLLDARCDPALLDAIMGRRVTRWRYGDAGLLQAKYDQLSLIAHPFDPSILDRLK